MSQTTASDARAAVAREGWGTNGGTAVVPREVAERDAASDPHLRGMIADGLPLSREVYLFSSHGGELPSPWTAEHEAELPECFRDPSAVVRDPLPPSARNHQD